MKSDIFKKKPYQTLKLDHEFLPMFLANQAFLTHLKKTNKINEVKIAIHRYANQISIFDTQVFKDNIGFDEDNFVFLSRLIKSLLWVVGGYEIDISCSEYLFNRLSKAFEENGKYDFDIKFMSKIYEKPFKINYRKPIEMPTRNESSKPLGRHLEGCRIGFDAGGSDRKVSAVIDGKAVFSEEVIWHPKLNSDPKYHYDGIMDSIQRAASHLPHVDAIGVSSAGIYIDNKIMAASLFLQVDEKSFEDKVKNMYTDIAKALGDVPIEVANDGDVTALAGAMSLDKNKVLGIAMGTSEAAGYVDEHGHITGWLNELAFVPVDYNEKAMVDEWSLDYGCGVKYFSQDAVIKLAKVANIKLDEKASPAEKLKHVQTLAENNDQDALEIFITIGIYLGYALLYYQTFYDIEHVLILGRVTSGIGGKLIETYARETIKYEAIDIFHKIKIMLPDEKTRRVGQAIAAASLPEIKE
jgi:predicted NBD/HSP70 family sugar kinase